MVQSLIKMILCFNKTHPHVVIDIHYFGGLRIDAVRNHMIHYAQHNKYDRILFLDDDMIFPENMITELWNSRFPIVSALYGSKSYPFHYFVMMHNSEKMEWLTKIEKDAIYHVRTVATGALLINMKIFEKLKRPYFVLRMDQVGRITATEDCYFGLTCFHAGIPMVVDSRLQCQHLKLVPFPAFFDHVNIHYDEVQRMGNVVDKVIQISPMQGFLWSDGVDECAHERQFEIMTNEGEAPKFKCLDCGLISQGMKVELMEKLSDDNS